MFSLRFTFLVIAILLIPYYLRYKGQEPYPALLLPSGGYNIKRSDNNTAVIESLEIYGLDGILGWKEINESKFLYPIPSHYFQFLAERNFGLRSKKELTRVDSLNLGAWLKMKLRQQHLFGSMIKMVSYRMRINLTNGRPIDSTIINEKIIRIP